MSLAEQELTEERVELKVFREVNARVKTEGGRLPWNKRAALVYEQFPSTLLLDWERAFDEDIELFGRIVRAILQLDLVGPGRDGPRPNLQLDSGLAALRQIMGTDYSVAPFAEAFATLAGDRSVRAVGHKADMDPSMVYRLMRGQREPTAEDMERIAAAFGKHPSYFAEWRSAYIVAALHARIEGTPEAGISLYRKLSRDAD